MKINGLDKGLRVLIYSTSSSFVIKSLSSSFVCNSSSSSFLKFVNETQEVCDIGYGEIPGLLSRLMAFRTIESVSTHQMPSQDEWIVDLELMGLNIVHRKNTQRKKGFY